MIKKYIAMLLIPVLILSLCSCTKKRQEPETVIYTPSATLDPHEGMIEVEDGWGGTVWINESEVLEPFALDRSAIDIGYDYADYNAEEYTLSRGIDVSEFQGDIDWQQVADFGIEYVIVRALWRGYSLGGLNVDENVEKNIAGAHEAGLDVGLYVFSTAITEEEATEEAEAVLELLNDYNIELPVFYDWERVEEEDSRNYETEGTVITACAKRFCEEIEKAGYKAGVYSYMEIVYSEYDLDQLADYTLWIADIGSTPVFYYEHEYWQYDAEGIIPGIESYVDLDIRYVKA